LQRVYDFERENRVVLDACRAATADILAVLRFVGRYAAWNGLFGAGVAALAGKIGRSRRLFLERAEPISALADRSVPVASYFFDAARDEFDDRDTAHRDTHRCLAQALLKGIIAYGRRERTEWTDPAFVNALLCEPVWLQALTARVGHGYGAMSPDELPAIFRCMGYHLGSEVLADQEFSIIDLALATDCPDLVAYLRHTEVEIAGRLHSAYRWFSIHSGHGGAVEAEHFAWATRGRAWPSIISSPISMTRCTSNCSWVSWISPATIASFSKTSTVLDIEEAHHGRDQSIQPAEQSLEGFRIPVDRRRGEEPPGDRLRECHQRHGDQVHQAQVRDRGDHPAPGGDRGPR
jgi:hypothetical protein